MKEPTTPPRLAAEPLSPEEEAALPPEVAALLDFEPVPRKVNRTRDGWNPGRQRRFIALIVELGSAQRAVAAMGKKLSGIEDLYREDGADEFRAAWDGAEELAAERERASFSAGPAREPPHRRAPGSNGGGEWADDDDDPELSASLLDNVVYKFLMKIKLEREARLAGKIAEADLYLRQITMLEVTLDLLAGGHGDAMRRLTDARRGGFNIVEIAATEMSRLLDAKRRMLWAMMDGSAPEPERPEHPPQRHLLTHETSAGTVWTEPGQAFGPASSPPHGVDPAAWATMGYERQRATFDAQYAADAQAQVEWERHAQEAWEASEHGARAQEARKASEHGARANNEEDDE